MYDGRLVFKVNPMLLVPMCLVFISFQISVPIA